MIDTAFAIPGDIAAPTGGYAYARKVLALLADYGVQPHHVPLPGSFPDPSNEDIARTQKIFAGLYPDTVTLIDGLAFGAMQPAVVDAIEQPIVALVHHPLAYETGISQAQAQCFQDFETHALSRARHVVVSSRTTAQLLNKEYGVATKSMTVAEPGTTHAIRAPGSGHHTTLQLLAVGSIIPRKGYADLIKALIPLTHIDWHLTIAGAAERDSSCATELREQILRTGLSARIVLAGAVGERDLQRLYTTTDIFVMSSHYEGYGMAISEAIARGLPIVCTTGGAMAKTAPDDVAIKVPPGNPEALSEALQRVLVNPELRQHLANNSWRAASQLPRWETSIEKIAKIIKSIHQATRT